MSTTPISLFTFTSDAAISAPATGQIVLPEGAEGFAAIFANLMNRVTGDQTGAEQAVSCPAAGLASEFSKLLPQLLKLYPKDLTEGVEVPTGTVEDTGGTLAEMSGTGGDQPAVDDVELVRRLLAGVAALFAAQQKGDAEGEQAVDGSEACSEKDAQLPSDDVQAQGEDPEPELTVSTDNSDVQDNGIAAMVALLLFAYMQSDQGPVGEQEPTVTPAMVTTAAGSGLGPEEGTDGNTVDPGQNAAGAAANGNGTQQASQDLQASKEIERLLQKMMAAVSDTETADAEAGQVEIQAAFAKEALKETTDVSAKKTDLKTAASPRTSFDALLLSGGKGVQAPQQDTDNATDNASETFVKGVSQLFDALEQQQNQAETETKDQPAPKENYQALAGKEPAAKGVAEQKSAVQQASPTHAVEKFEKTLEQLTAKTGLNEMRVRLNIGNDESVILGLKDLGQSINVEVKASHQAIIGLLESQKDTITKHLEARDVHTNIYIDPDSSARQDQKDRREGKQHLRTLRSRNGADGFAEVLDVLS